MSTLRPAILLLTISLLVAAGPASAQRAERQRDGKPADSPGVQGFPVAAPAEGPRSFGEAEASSSRPESGKASKRGDSASRLTRERARRYARSLVRRYDENKNGRLEKNEWRNIRGSPAKSDANGDGVLTVDEITNRVSGRLASNRKGSGPSQPPRSGSRARGEPARPSAAPAPADGRKSHRFTPASERLPDGLPGWFKSRDKDRDGQVAMHEYAQKWSGRTVREFERLDKNGDGLITPGEAERR